MPTEITHAFRVTNRDCRIHSGPDALAALGAELKRNGVSRALVLTGNTIATKTDLPARIEAASDGRVAGLFGGIGKDTPLSDVLAATEKARELKADGLIALGGGSVMQAARVAAIFLAEDGTPEELATQYPENAPAVSPRLNAPKLPILNIPTIGTTAQDRGGSPVKWPEGGRRLEYFDPKTRPSALFWDEGALATAPVSMLTATAAMLRWRAVLDMGARQAPVLVAFNRRQVFEITGRIVQALARGDDGATTRADLCIATWLHNRQADEGGRPVNTWTSRVNYAFSTALFHHHGHIAQGEAVTALAPGTLRSLGHRDAGALALANEALGLSSPDPAALADRMAEEFTSIGMPTSLAAFDIPAETDRVMLDGAMNNFNADPKREFLSERPALEAALAECHRP